MENQYTLDEPMVFNGTIDRFDWKLVGKKEIYVPYGSFGATDFKAKFEDVAGDDYIAENAAAIGCTACGWWKPPSRPACATSRPSALSISTKTAGTWSPPMTTDAQGKLWKHREAYVIPV
jgi:hypothetical protein